MKLELFIGKTFNLIEDQNHEQLIAFIENSEPFDNKDILVKLYLKNNHDYYVKYFHYNEENRRKLLHILEEDYNEYEDTIIEFMEFIKIEDL